MEKQITINVPEGKELVQSTDKDGNITIKFVDKEPIRSKSWEEYCKNNPDNFAFAKNIDCPIDLVDPIEALIRLTRLHDEWVGDWKFNWEDEKNIKWGIYAYNNTIDIFTLTVSHRLLVFPSFRMAKEFLGCFSDLLEKAKRYI